MTVSTTSAAVHITPVVFKTFYKHVKTKGRKHKDGDHHAVATDDVFFDEAFHIVKSFIELGTLNTVESLQGFTNTHVPAPYWCAVSPALVPLASCNKAADALIDWFGPDELKQVVGGEKWWQVRGIDGIEGEWVTEKEYLTEDITGDKKVNGADTNILRMEHLETVMLYVHGGGYFWGSINTHRYQIIRYARKIKGRAFAVNYRKAPQYPWPCPVQDVLAAYFYLTSPPPGSLHKPIPPSKIVMAGDSAGAGLCLSVLTVLRDLGIEQPAGAVLISPWVDLTHSFPSVMKNTATDIIPPHGFIHKPSPIWPIQSLPREAEARVVPTETNPPPEPGHADTLRPDDERLTEQVEQRMEKSKDEGRSVHTREVTDEKVQNQAGMLRHSQEYGGNGDSSSETTPGVSAQESTLKDDPNYDDALSFWEPKPPKVLMKDPNARPLELRGQIQLYATNEQLSHPLVSPILQGSLGNLCPLYIIAGDAEVLRDEIIYLAHKAANPTEYPTRKGVLREAHRQRENVEKFQKPTKVHLQVFDGMCHVLTVFTFTPSAKYAYRSIAEFIKHVTIHSAEHLERNPFPELHIPPVEIDDPALNEEERPRKARVSSRNTVKLSAIFKRNETSNNISESSSHRSDVNLFKQNEQKAKEEVEKGVQEQFVTSKEDCKGKEKVSDIDSSLHADRSDVPGVSMIRERVDIAGKVRPMEPKEDIEALCIPPRQLGIIKEEPVKRWQSGQELWDKKFKRHAVQAERRREQYEKKFETIIERARKNGFELHSDSHRPPIQSRASTGSVNSQGEIVADRRWGPFDLDEEQPPPSAIAGRQDNRESLALIKKSIYYTAPVTHKTVPKRGAADTMRAAFDTEDNMGEPPKQSVSEAQQPANIIPFHGLRIWQGLLNVFLRKSSAKAAHGKEHVESALRLAGGHSKDRGN